MPSTQLDTPKVFGARLKGAREAAGLTQRELGMKAGLSEEVASVRINRYEKGVHDPDHTTARKIADALGVPLAYLYADNDLIAEAILAFGLLSQAEQRKAVAELRERAFSQGSRKRG